MSKPYKAVFFDLDGTLLDTSPGIFNGLDMLIEEFNLTPIDDDVKAKFIGPPLSESYPKYLGLTGDKLKKAIKRYREYCAAQGYKEVNYYPGIDKLLDWLHDNDYLTFVVTMKEDKMAHKTISATNFYDKFTEIVGNTDIDSKSKSDLIKNLLDKYNLSRDEVLLVGDTIVDAEGAKKAGIDYFPATFGFGYSHGDIVDNDSYPYILKLNNPKDLINYLSQKEGTNGTC